jgi:hypothetical protein
LSQPPIHRNESHPGAQPGTPGGRHMCILMRLNAMLVMVLEFDTLGRVQIRV